MIRSALRAMIATVVVAIPAGFLLAGEAKLETRAVKIPASAYSFEMVKVPAGTIELDKDGQAEKVEVKSFWIAKTELTWDAYDPFAFCLDLTDQQKADGVDAANRPSKPYGAPDRGFGHDGFAAISIHSHAAEMYCKWLSAKTGKKFRLPTEAEWEYAARAGGPEVKLERAALDKVAWFTDNSETETGDKTPQAVGKKAPNAWGLYDMLGNVGEWVMGYDGQMVLKGGWYDQRAARVTSSVRAPYNTAWQMRDPQDPKSQWWLSDGAHVGFRVVCDD